MPGVRAVLALAPYAAPFVAHGTMSDFAVPVMFQSGALDDGITAAIRKRGGAFDEARGPKYFVEFRNARHSSWGNAPHAAHDAMLSYAAAFLDRYVRGESDGDVLDKQAHRRGRFARAGLAAISRTFGSCRATFGSNQISAHVKGGSPTSALSP